MSDKLPSKNKTVDGRPKTDLDGAELLDLAHEYDCLIGPAHAFTPWTGMYKYYDSIYDCYGSKPDFVELGLSADTYMADTIDELKDFVFLSNSDAHSPWPHRLGREYNQIELADLSYSSIKKAFKNRDIKANYGLVPNLGKYHMTACTKCYKLVDPEIAKQNRMKCSCGGTIKKGVDLTTKTVQRIWQKLIDSFGSEIDVLINAPLADIDFLDSRTSCGIKNFRNNTVEIIPGGGGKYGEILFKKEIKTEKVVTLDNF